MSQEESFMTARLSLSPDRVVDHGLVDMDHSRFTHPPTNGQGQDMLPQEKHQHVDNVDTTTFLGSVWNLFKDARDLATREIDRLLEHIPYNNNQKSPGNKDRILQPKKERTKVMLGHGPSSIASKKFLGPTPVERHWSRLVDEDLRRSQTNDLTPTTRVRAMPRAGSAPLPPRERTLQEPYTPLPPRASLSLESRDALSIRTSTLPSTSSSTPATTATSMKRKKSATGPSKTLALETTTTKYNRQQRRPLSNGTAAFRQRLSTSILPNRTNQHYHHQLIRESDGWGSSTSTTPEGYEEDSESSSSSSMETFSIRQHIERESSLTRSITSLADLMNLSDGQSTVAFQRRHTRSSSSSSHRQSDSEHSSRRRSLRRTSAGRQHRSWARTDNDDDEERDDSEGRRILRRPRSALDMYSLAKAADPMRTYIPPRPTTPQFRPSSSQSSSFLPTQPQPQLQPSAMLAPANDDHDKLNKLQEELAAIKAQLATLVSAQQEDSRRLSWPAGPPSSIPPPPPPPPLSGLNSAKKWSIPSNEVAQSMQNVLKELSSSQHKLRKTNSPYLTRVNSGAPEKPSFNPSSSGPAATTSIKDSPSQKAVMTLAGRKLTRQSDVSAAPLAIDELNKPVVAASTAVATAASLKERLRTIPKSSSPTIPPVNSSNFTSTTTHRSSNGDSGTASSASFQLWARRTTTPRTTSLTVSSQPSSQEDTFLRNVLNQESRTKSLPSVQHHHHTTLLSPSLTPPNSLSADTFMDKPGLVDQSEDGGQNTPSSSSSGSARSIMSSSSLEAKRRQTGGCGPSDRHSFSLLRGDHSKFDTSGESGSTTRTRIVDSPIASTHSLSSQLGRTTSDEATVAAVARVERKPLSLTGFKRPRPARASSSSSSSSVTLQRSMTDPLHLSSSERTESSSHGDRLHHDAKRISMWSETPQQQQPNVRTTSAPETHRKQVTFASSATTTTASSSQQEVGRHQHERERKWFRELDNDSWRVSN